ncbi:MAG: hypothetical protein U0892_10655 [Pirellulales bacterium]
MTPNSFPYQITRNTRSLFCANRRRLSYQSLELRSLLASDGLLIESPPETLSTLQVCEAATVAPAAEENDLMIPQAVDSDAAIDQAADPTVNDQVLSILINPDVSTNVPFSLDAGYQLLLQLPVSMRHRSSTLIGSGLDVAQGDELLGDSALNRFGQASNDEAFAIEIDYPSDALWIASPDDADANAIHVVNLTATDVLLSQLIDFRALRQLHGTIESRVTLENVPTDATQPSESIWIAIKPTSEAIEASAFRQFRMTFVLGGLDDGHWSAGSSQAPATNNQQQIGTQTVESDFDPIPRQPTEAQPAPAYGGSCDGPSSHPGEKVVNSDNEGSDVENKSSDSPKITAAPEVKNPALSTLAIGATEFRTTTQTILAQSSLDAAANGRPFGVAGQRTNYPSYSADTTQEVGTKRSGMRDRPTAIRLSRDPFELVASAPAPTLVARSKSPVPEQSGSQQPMNAEPHLEVAGTNLQVPVVDEAIAATGTVEPSVEKSVEPKDLLHWIDSSRPAARDEETTAADESGLRMEISKTELVGAKELFSNPASYGAFVLVAAMIARPLEYDETQKKRRPARDI